MASSCHNSSANYLYLIIGTPLVAFLIAASQAIEAHGLHVPLARIGISIAGLTLQAIPFMLLGAMMSAAVATFVTASFLERHIPRTTIGGFAVALVAGLCMPVCDCMAVPTFANLLRKRLPVPCAVTFLVAVPIMNPMAIWSTWYAFPNDPWMVFRRMGLGALMALLVGATFAIRPAGRGPVRPENSHEHDRHADAHARGHDIPCRCSGAHGHSMDRRESRLRHFLRHTHDDFLRMMPVLLFGSAIASIIRVAFGDTLNADIAASHPLIAIVGAMAIAFLCSVCSSSDAVIASGMSGMLPISALLAFLTFGPVLDVKNTMMLGIECRTGFTLRLAVTITVVCASLASLVHVVFGI